MNPKKIWHIFNKLSLAIPKPTTELVYSSNYELLIAVILSARTTDKIVNKITEKLFKVANTPEKVCDLGPKKLKQYIKSSGFFNIKTENIVKTSRILREKFDSSVPETLLELEKLPGVGRKTANVILNIAFNQPTIAVDTHVFRVAKRLGLSSENTPLKVEATLLKIVPYKFAKIAGNLLLLHGRYVCTSVKPKCEICSIKKLCNYKLQQSLKIL